MRFKLLEAFHYVCCPLNLQEFAVFSIPMWFVTTSSLQFQHFQKPAKWSLKLGFKSPLSSRASAPSRVGKVACWSSKKERFLPSNKACSFSLPITCGFELWFTCVRLWFMHLSYDLVRHWPDETHCRSCLWIVLYKGSVRLRSQNLTFEHAVLQVHLNLVSYMTAKGSHLWL